MEYILYKPAKLKGRYPGKFIEYYFRHPETNKWQRFKVKEEINRNRTDFYDKALLKAVNDALKSGFNPFTNEHPYKVPVVAKEDKVLTITAALRAFLGKWKERGQDDETMVRYTRAIRYFESWLALKGLQFLPADQITEDHIQEALQHLKVTKSWSNRTYNNTLDFLSTCFNYLQKKGMIKVNPCVDVHSQRVVSRKHRYYDDKTLTKVMTLMKEQDPYLHFAAQVVYHLCVRSEKELQHLKVGNIYPDRMQVLLQVTKTKTERYIPMNEQILKIFRDRGVLDYPADDYVFSVAHKNKFLPDGTPGPTPFATGFFSRRFSRIRKKAGLSSDWTLYGYKHTRVIHLKKDGASDADIMALTGHKDFASYAAYLRDLGADFNPEKLHRLSREI